MNIDIKRLQRYLKALFKIHIIKYCSYILVLHSVQIGKNHFSEYHTCADKIIVVYDGLYNLIGIYLLLFFS